MKAPNIAYLRDRLMVQYVRKGVIFASEDHFIYLSSDNGKSWKIVCEINYPNVTLLQKGKSQVLRKCFIRKFRRNIGFHNVLVLPTGTILVHYDGIYRYNESVNKVFDFTAQKIIGPLTNGFAVDERTGCVYFGEYTNTRPSAVRIFRGREDGRKWEVCHTFPSGRIKHVHTLVYDRYRERLWICTGDTNEETGLFYTDDDFQTVNLFAGGDQSWRMVSLLPTRDALYWGSDAGQDAPAEAINYIYKWDFKKNRRETLACINKPAYYSTRLRDGTFVIGVHHEPGLKRRVEPSAEIWTSPDGNKWKKVIELPYHKANRKVGTKYASICLPAGDDSADAIYFTPLNVKQYDFTLLRLEV